MFHAAQAAGVSRQTAYRWQREDPEFADQWEEARENAVDVVESTIYQQAVGGNTIAAIFYLKAHRPIYRDRLNIDIEQVKGEIEERMAQLKQRLTSNGTAELIKSNGTAELIKDALLLGR